MIKTDQPTIFDASVVAAVSSVDDGNMKFGIGNDEDVIQNRRQFLQELGIDLNKTTLVPITYDTEDFTRYRIVVAEDKGANMTSAASPVTAADALVATEPNHALFLPIADCVGVIIHDPTRHILMVSHVGRHSAEVDGGAKSVDYLQKHFAVKAEDLHVWLSPAVGSETYPLHKFEGKSLHDVIISQLLRAGVERTHIQVSDIDTAKDDNYFSHSQYLKDPSNAPGRFAVVAMMNS